MIHQYKAKQAQMSSNPHLEFAKAISNYTDQVYTMDPKDVNLAIQTHPDLKKWHDKSLTASQIWQGEKLKGKAPQVFTHPILVCAVIEGSVQHTAYGERYIRVSIQPSWITGALVIVKEETHADDVQHKMIFLGREVDMLEAKALLIPAILNDIAAGAEKATKLIPVGYTQGEAQLYLENNFERIFYNERPALFHVQHGIIEQEGNPFETWDLVRLCPSDPTQMHLYQQLRGNISSSVSSKLFEETLKNVENKRILSN